jgi:hypothetical protein
LIWKGKQKCRALVGEKNLHDTSAAESVTSSAKMILSRNNNRANRLALSEFVMIAERLSVA